MGRFTWERATGEKLLLLGRSTTEFFHGENIEHLVRVDGVYLSMDGKQVYNLFLQNGCRPFVFSTRKKDLMDAIRKSISCGSDFLEAKPCPLLNDMKSWAKAGELLAAEPGSWRRLGIGMLEIEFA